MSLPSSQLQALQDLYSATNGSYWTYETCKSNHYWNFSQPDPNPCMQQWCGIVCNSVNTTVLSLNLVQYVLQGTLPKSLDQLIDLQILNLDLNHLYGTIPTSLVNLTNLVTLSLSNNNLYGNLTNLFTNESKLSYIDISSNRFHGLFPISFQTLSNIQVLDIGANHFYGELSSWLTAKQLNQLQLLSVYNNLFSGTFPSLNNLTSLTGLYLEYNSFIGTIPDIFYHCKNITNMYLSNNQFIGTFPPSFFELSSLKYFVADHNYFTVKIDDMNWTYLSNLLTVSISDNYLVGSFPLSLCSLTNLQVLSFSINLLSGSLAINDCQNKLYTTIKTLTLQENSFTGPLHEIFNTSRDHSAVTIALNNNQFTGSIPGEFFLNALGLHAYAVGTNCLSGTIPKEICQLKELVGFSIDGASTSENCRIPIVDIPSIGLNAFFTKNIITGTIPECLIKTFQGTFLSLSGNALSGTLPEYPVNNKLGFSFYASHNQLTGTIPLSWYNQLWSTLDLSYNKFTGTFPSNSEIILISPYSDVSLQQNRISGTIPSIFQTTPQAETLTILEGNMLTCNINKSQLPKNDPDYSTYVCGSNIVNNSIYLWIIVLCSIITSGICWKLIKSYQRYCSRIEEIEEKRKIESNSILTHVQEIFTVLFINNSLKSNQSSIGPSINLFFNYTLQIRRYSMIILLFIFIVFIPVYASLGVYYRTFSERYAWTIAPIFLSGTQATIILTIFFALFVLFAIRMIFLMFNNAVRLYYRRQSNWCGRSEINLKVLGIWSLAWMINLMIMVTADSLYVYLIISHSTTYDYVLQILLALFKLAWHDIGIFRMVYYLRTCFKEELNNQERKGEPSSLSFSFSDDGVDGKNRGSVPLLSSSFVNSLSNQPMKYRSSPFALSSQDIRYLSYMSIVNKVIIPCLAIFFISSSCFYNALVAQSPLTAFYGTCYNTSPTTQECVNILGSSGDSSSYTPSFSYSYQCSSAFLTDYVPVFVFMFLWSSVAVPLIVFLMAHLNEYLDRRERKSWFILSMYKLSQAFLPLGWDDRNQGTFSEEVQTQLQGLILHRKHLLTIRVSYTLAVLFVFGSLFPPLAMIATIAVINITALEDYLTKRMLGTSQSSQMVSDYALYLEEECKDIDRNVFKILRLIIFVMCGLFGFLLFDVCGDTNGWSNGIVTMIVMVLFPSLVYWLISRMVKFRKFYK